MYRKHTRVSCKKINVIFKVLFCDKFPPCKNSKAQLLKSSATFWNTSSVKKTKQKSKKWNFSVSNRMWHLSSAQQSRYTEVSLTNIFSCFARGLKMLSTYFCKEKFYLFIYLFELLCNSCMEQQKQLNSCLPSAKSWTSWKSTCRTLRSASIRSLLVPHKYILQCWK